MRDITLDVKMGSRPRPYLTGPQRRRLTPWFWIVTMVVLIASSYAADRKSWVGPLFILLGATVGAQGIDALRTGKLLARFPNKWPVDADRPQQPINFWLSTVLYLALGFMLAGIGVAGIAGWIEL